MRVETMPRLDRTLHLIGDPHLGVPEGYAESGGLAKSRKDIFLADLTLGTVPLPARGLVMGDFTNNPNNAENDAAALAWRASLQAATGTVYDSLCGNHDVWEDKRTPDQWAEAMGIAKGNRKVDLGYCLLLMPQPYDSGMSLPTSGLTWLGTELTAATKPCVICFHAPLFNSHVTANSAHWNSTQAGFWAYEHGAASQDPATVLAVLDAHDTAVAWISGHTHPEMSDSLYAVRGIAKAVDVGTRSIAHFTIPGLFFNGAWTAVEGFYGSAYSSYLTVLDDQVQMRWRNHTAQTWDAPVGEPSTVRSYSFAELEAAPVTRPKRVHGGLYPYDDLVRNAPVPLGAFYNGETGELPGRYGLWLFDKSPYGNHCLLVGGAMAGTEIEVDGYKDGITLNGSSGYARGPLNPFINGQVVTIEFAVKRFGTGEGTIIASEGHGSEYASVRYASGSGGGISLGLNNKTSASSSAFWKEVWLAEELVHGVLRIDQAAGKADLTVNGVAKEQKTLANSTSYPEQIQQMLLGARGGTANVPFTFLNGQIGKLAIYLGDALSLASDHYKALTNAAGRPTG